MKINKKHVLLFTLIFAGMLIFATGTCSAVGKVYYHKNKQVWTYKNGWHSKTLFYNTKMNKYYSYKKYTKGGFYTTNYGKTKYTKKYYYKGKLKYKTTYRQYKQKVYTRYTATWTKKEYYYNAKYACAGYYHTSYDKWILSGTNYYVDCKYISVKKYAKQYY